MLARAALCGLLFFSNTPALLSEKPNTSAPAPTSPPDHIASLRALALPVPGEVLSVEHLPAVGAPQHLPPRTVMKAVLHPAKGSNIQIEIWLPEPANWNGRFLGLGNGGAAGKINPSSFTGYIREGFAVATTDMGTAPSPASGNGNPEVWQDFGWRATHLMTVLGKQATTTRYGRAPEYSYFNGGSTGGQQALQEAQRYPEDYDGIVANVPAHCRTPLHAYFLWNDQVLRACPFTEAQEAGIIAAANAHMAPRELPQTAGKMVSDPRCTAADIEAVIALARKNDATLTDQHTDAMRKLFTGPRHAFTGRPIFGGVPLGSAFKTAHGHLYLFHWVFGAEKDLSKVDFGADYDAYTAALAPHLNAENPDLTAFHARGGRLIMLSGSADSVVPYHATLAYYERVISHFGSVEKVQSFFRYYLVPGMGHGPGPGVNSLPSALQQVIQWREKGVPPGTLHGKRFISGKEELAVVIHPWPPKPSRSH